MGKIVEIGVTDKGVKIFVGLRAYARASSLRPFIIVSGERSKRRGVKGVAVYLNERDKQQVLDVFCDFRYPVKLSGNYRLLMNSEYVWDGESWMANPYLQFERKHMGATAGVERE